MAMSSAISIESSNLLHGISNFFKQKKISSQVAISFTLVLLLTVAISNFFTNAGMRYLFHHQAARSIEFVIDKMNASNEVDIDKKFLNTNLAFSGVIVRVLDENKNLVADSNSRFPATEKMLSHVVKDRPFFATKGYELIETAHSFFYYREVPFQVDGKIFHVQLFKTITFEKELMEYMAWFNFLLDVVAIILAVVIGSFFIKKVLNPLRRVTETAREISAGKMDRRLEVENSSAEAIELSESFNSMLDKINKTFDQQRQFISDVSHELRTPVTVIDGYTQILEKFGAKNKDLLDESVTSIKGATDNMKNLLESLLFLARADQSEQPLNKVDVDVEEILKSTVESYNNSRINFSSDGNFQTFGDPTALQKMFDVILNNALEYSDDEVTVKLKILGNIAKVNFVDKGIGISADDKKKIFDRFFRADKVRTKSDDDKSVGLGLSIAKWIADNHGIEFEVESELNKGTTFKCVMRNA